MRTPTVLRFGCSSRRGTSLVAGRMKVYRPGVAALIVRNTVLLIVHEHAELGEVPADQGEVVLRVELADLPDPFDALAVAELAAQREAGVGRVGDQPAGAQDVDDLADHATLRVDRVHIEVPRHARQLRAVGKQTDHGCGLACRPAGVTVDGSWKGPVMAHTLLDPPRPTLPSGPDPRRPADADRRGGRFERARAVLEDARSLIERGWLQHGWYLADRPPPRSLLARLRQVDSTPGDRRRAAGLPGRRGGRGRARRRRRPDVLTDAGPALDMLWDALWEDRGQTGPSVGRAGRGARGARRADA